MPGMRRREFVSAARRRGGAGRLRRARSSRERMRRIGVLMPSAADDANCRPASGRSCKGCSNWAGPIGRNLRIDMRWAAGDADRNRRHAAELVALAPDVILASGSPTMEPLLQVTRTVPIVFASRRRSGRRRVR